MMMHEQIAEVLDKASALLPIVKEQIASLPNDEDAKIHGEAYMKQYAIDLCKVRDSLDSVVRSTAVFIDYIAPA